MLCEAFHGYPVMRHVLGSGPDYGRRLRVLIGFFLAARYLREDLVLGLVNEAAMLAAVALVSLPGGRPPPRALDERREAVWRELGAAERGRYEAYGAACARFDLEAPHHHLNMIGVRPVHAGRGHARALLDRVHALADADPASLGVTLTTETERNVDFYRHFGYGLLGHARVAAGLETWVFHRPRAHRERA